MNKDHLDPGKLEILDNFIDQIPDKNGSLINILHEAQDLFGYLPQELQLHISRKCDIPAAKVFGVVTFYSYFSITPKGKHKISICMGTACFVKGAEKVLKEFKIQLGITDGNISKDGLFSIDTLRCIGACGLAPVVNIDGNIYGHVKPEDVKKIIEEIRNHDNKEAAND